VVVFVASVVGVGFGSGTLVLKVLAGEMGVKIVSVGATEGLLLLLCLRE